MTSPMLNSTRPCALVLARKMLVLVPLLVLSYGAFGRANDEPDVEPNLVVAPPQSLVHFHLGGALTETPMEDPFGLLGGQLTSLKDLTQRMREARRDPAVKAVVLTFDNMQFGLAQLEEVRRAIQKLKEAHKPVLVHAEDMTTPEYALLSAASTLRVSPRSTLWLTGLYGESIYLKTLLEKIGVEADILQTGDYKSAGESFTRTAPSEAAQENIDWLLDGIYESLVDMIGQSRGMEPQRVRELIDQGPYLAEAAVDRGLIDAVQTRHEFLSAIRQEYGSETTINNRYGQTRSQAVNFANPFSFLAAMSRMAPKDTRTGAVIALIYVEGMILPGHATADPFGGSDGAYAGDIRKALEQAAADDAVKAVVLRVDSPGGSAQASEVIWNAVRHARAQKPVVASMGNVAASGGYYVSCGAHAIFCDQTTLTASIGVVGGKLVTADLWQKLGVNWVGHKRGANADVFNALRRFDDAQRQKSRDYMDAIYSDFKAHVQAGRGDTLTKPIEDIAGGRVYTGAQARELGLVDRIGGLCDAVLFAAALARVPDYDLRVMPPPADVFTKMLQTMAGNDQRPTDLSVLAKLSAPGRAPDAFESLFALLHQVNPQRGRAMSHLLAKLRLIRESGAALVMPQELVLH